MQSADVAPPEFSMKFACLGDTSAPPIAKPFSPHSSIIRPAPGEPSGFLKTLPNVRLLVGCVALRRPRSSPTRAFTASRDDAWRRTRTSATT